MKKNTAYKIFFDPYHENDHISENEKKKQAQLKIKAEAIESKPNSSREVKELSLLPEYFHPSLRDPYTDFQL